MNAISGVIRNASRLYVCFCIFLTLVEIDHSNEPPLKGEHGRHEKLEGMNSLKRKKCRGFHQQAFLFRGLLQNPLIRPNGFVRAFQQSHDRHR